MRHVATLATLAFVAIAGCSNAAAPLADQPGPAAYDPAMSMAPNCAAGRSVDLPVHARTIAVVERSGDLARVRAHYAAMRAAIEASLRARGQSAVDEARPMLDAAFSASTVHRQAVCDFTRYSRTAAMIDAWDAWAADARLRAVHERMVAVAQAKPAAHAPDTARRDLLRRIWIATGKADIQVAATHARAQVVAAVQRGLDPAAAQEAFESSAFIVRQESEAAGVDARFASRLADVSDRDLEAFVAWAESGPGRTYYRSLLATYSGAQLDWAAGLSRMVEAQLAPKIVPLGPEAIQAQLDDIRRSIETVGPIYPKYALRERIGKLAMRDPANPGVQAVRARLEVELHLQRPDDETWPPRDARLLRDSDRPEGSDATVFANAMHAIDLAIAAAPQDGELQALAGYVAFLSMQDAEAARRFDAARRSISGSALLAQYEGDLAYAQGAYAKAEKRYRAALAAAGPADFTRYRAATHLALALAAMGRDGDYDAVAAEQMAAMPTVWAYRAAYADNLLDRGVSAERVDAVIAPIPEDWEPSRMRSLRNRLGFQRIIDAPAALRPALARTAFTQWFDGSDIARAACLSRMPSIIETVQANLPKGYPPDEIPRAMLACAILRNRPEALAVALRQVKDVNAALPGMETPLCAAARKYDAKSIGMLLGAGADRERACGDGTAPRQRLATAADRGFAPAKAALDAFDAAR